MKRLRSETTLTFIPLPKSTKEELLLSLLPVHWQQSIEVLKSCSLEKNFKVTERFPCFNQLHNQLASPPLELPWPHALLQFPLGLNLAKGAQLSPRLVPSKASPRPVHSESRQRSIQRKNLDFGVQLT